MNIKIQDLQIETNQDIPESIFVQQQPAHIIQNDAEAIETAKKLAKRFKQQASHYDRAGDYVDAALENLNEDNANAATLAVAEAKVLSAEIAILASNKLFELAGTRAALSELNLDRHWRNARIHTLHDPVRWKYKLIGEYYLKGKYWSRHPWS